MIKSLRLFSSAVAASLVAFSAGNAAAQAPLKFATVDMAKVFDNYYKTKEAEQSIKQANDQAKKEIDDKMATYKKEVEATQKLGREANDEKMLSPEARANKARLFQEKVNEVRNMEREIGEFRARLEKQISDQMRRIRGSIVEEIMVLVQDEVKARGYDVVLDKSSTGMTGVSVFLFTKADLDFSDVIIAKLNEKKPAGSTVPDASPAPAASAAPKP